MSRNLMRMALIMVATAAYAQDDIFGCSSPRLDAPSGNIPSDKQKCQTKAQHEFIIKGIKIMAASKKDAMFLGKNKINVHFLIRKIKKNGEPYKDVNESWGIDYFSLEKVVE